MFFVEPPPTQYDLRFNVAGVPVRVHPMFWLVTLIRASGNPEPLYVLLWVIAVFVSILIHEMGHVAAFRYFGMNAHVVLYGFGGLAIPSGGAWNVGHRQRRDWLSDVVIRSPARWLAFCSPRRYSSAWPPRDARRSIFFSPSLLVGFRWRPLESDAVEGLLRDIQFINIFWGLVNLLPIYPLDGGQISRAVISRFNPANGLRQSMWLSVYAAAAMAALCYLHWHDLYLALFFAYMAFQNYQILRHMGGGYGGGW